MPLQRFSCLPSTSYQFLQFLWTQFLKLLQRAQASGIPFSGPESSTDTPALRALLRKAAPSAVSLLKNDPAGSVPLLPLAPDKFPAIHKITVIGSNAKYAVTFGGGSAHTLCRLCRPSLLLRANWPDVEVRYEPGSPNHKHLPDAEAYASGGISISGTRSLTQGGPGCGANWEWKSATWSIQTNNANLFLADRVVCVSRIRVGVARVDRSS